MNSLRSRLSFVKRGATLYRYPSQYLSGSSREPPASALGELMVTIRASPPDQSPRTSYCTIVLFGSQVISLVRLTGLPAFNSVHPRRIRCRSQHRGMGYHPLRMKIRWAAPLGCCHQLTAMLARAAMSMAALAAKAYSAAGQAASAMHAMAILQVHQAKALKQMHEGSTDHFSTGYTPKIPKWAWCRSTVHVTITPTRSRSFSPCMDLVFLQVRVPLEQLPSSCRLLQ